MIGYKETQNKTLQYTTGVYIMTYISRTLENYIKYVYRSCVKGQIAKERLLRYFIQYFFFHFRLGIKKEKLVYLKILIFLSLFMFSVIKFISLTLKHCVVFQVFLFNT